MTTSQEGNSCHVCNISDGTIKCLQCDRVFCYSDFLEHRQEIADHLRQVKIICENLQKETADYKQNIDDHPLMKAIDDWMNESIVKVRQAANEAKETLREMLSKHVSQVEAERQRCHSGIIAAESAGHADEVKVRRWSAQVDEFKAKIKQPPGVTLNEDSSTLVKPIRVCNTSDASTPLYAARWNLHGETVAHGLCHPHGLCFDEDQTMYIADWGNDRILAWKVGAKQGEVVAGGNGEGVGLDQLDCPTDVIVDREANMLLICDSGNRRVMRWRRRPHLSGIARNYNGDVVINGIDCFGLAMDDEGALYVSDTQKHEVRRYDKGGDKTGIVVAGGHGEGAGLHQLAFPTYLFVDAQKTLYVSDSKNRRVMKWIPRTKEGSVVAGKNRWGEEVTQVCRPYGVWVDGRGDVYVADEENHIVMRCEKGATRGKVIVGGNGRENEANQLYHPQALLFDSHGHLYVVDSGNGRIQRFSLL